MPLTSFTDQTKWSKTVTLPVTVESNYIKFNANPKSSCNFFPLRSGDFTWYPPNKSEMKLPQEQCRTEKFSCFCYRHLNRTIFTFFDSHFTIDTFPHLFYFVLMSLSISAYQTSSSYRMIFLFA